MSPSPPRLSAQDVSFLDRAAAGTPLNVGGLIRLARTPDGLDLERMREVVSTRLARLPRLRERVVAGPHGTAWQADPSFRVERHVDRLPFTADDPSLLGHVAKLHASSLDRWRPLWRLDLVPQGRRGGPALLFRASHAAVDGMSAMQVMRALFDPAGAASGASSGLEAAGASDGPGPGAGARAVDLPDAFEVARDLWASLDPGRREELEPGRYERALALLDGWLSMLDRGWHGMPRFPASGPVRTRIALAELPSRAVRRLRRELGARFDVVGLTLVGDALARLFRAKGEADPEARIRTLVPVAVSTGARRADLGNRASYLLVALPIGPMAPLDRLRLVAAEVDEALASGQHKAAAMSMRALETAPPESVDAISAFTARGHFVDLVVSCIPGSRRPLSFAGIAHEATFPLLPITPQVRVAVGMADVGGHLGVAAVVDEHALPELDFLVDGITRAGSALAGTRPSDRPRRPPS